MTLQDVTCFDVPWSVSHSELVTEQRADGSLKALLEVTRPFGEVKNHTQCYFMQNDVLMRKWVSHGEDFVGEPVYQVVVPSTFRSIADFP